MKQEQLINFAAGLAFASFAIFLAMVLFIKPDFLEPVTNWIHNFGVITIGSIRLSIGGTIAIILFFGFMVPSAYGIGKKKHKK